jgi:hypothetical protein
VCVFFLLPAAVLVLEITASRNEIRNGSATVSEGERETVPWVMNCERKTACLYGAFVCQHSDINGWTIGVRFLTEVDIFLVALRPNKVWGSPSLLSETVHQRGKLGAVMLGLRKRGGLHSLLGLHGVVRNESQRQFRLQLC